MAMQMFSDKQVLCQACGMDFPFSAQEQEFFAQKGFQEPKKCKPCRDNAKAQRGGGYNNAGFGGYQRQERTFYDAVCAGCGMGTQVPFRPNGSKPVYCRDCFRASQAAY